MPYFTITDFAAGLDLRRSSLTAPAGTLRALRNAHVTPGGEIEKRFSFVKFAEVDPASKGLVEVNQNLYVFAPGGPGSVEPTADWTVGTLKLQCSSLVEIVDYDLFRNKVFVVAQVDTAGNVVRCYDGTLVPDANGYYVRTYKTKIFSVAGSSMYNSASNSATDWTSDTSDINDLGLGDSDMTDLIALEAYYDKLAVFSKTACQLWIINNDPLQNQFVQTLRQAGTVAWRSVLSYGSGDVLYVAPDGIRSLRARNASLSASVSDVGSPLDPVMQELFRTRGEAYMSQIISILQPVTGRFWVILPDHIFVLSAFPGPKVTAWSEYLPIDVDGNPFTITAATVYKMHVVVRDENNNVYSFGGAADTGVVYDTSPVEIIFPFHAGDQPATFKSFKGLDCTCTGNWKVYASFDPTTEAEDYLGMFTGPTFLEGRFPVEGHSTHISLRLRSDDDWNDAMTLSNITVHYELAEQG